MTAQLTMPYPLQQMLGHLDLDVDRCFRAMPQDMEDAMQKCYMCPYFRICDYDSESRYFLCPNRDLLDCLEDAFGKETRPV